MAAQHEVEDVLVCTIAQAVYPDGTAAASATGTPARIYRGWPQPTPLLDNDLAAGIVNISVFPENVERNLTKNPLDWQEQPQPPIELTMAVSGNTVTVGGRVTCPLNAAVLIDGKAFVYPLQATDTPTRVATALAALIGTATSSGPVITIPKGVIEARIGTVGNIVQEVRRQIKSFRISLWCPSPDARDAMAGVVDAALASTDYLNLPDGTAGRLLYVGNHSDDSGQKTGRWRWDFVYSVEYSTTIVTDAAAVVSLGINLYGGDVTTSPPIETINI